LGKIVVIDFVGYEAIFSIVSLDYAIDFLAVYPHVAIALFEWVAREDHNRSVDAIWTENVRHPINPFTHRAFHALAFHVS